MATALVTRVIVPTTIREKDTGPQGPRGIQGPVGPAGNGVVDGEVVLTPKSSSQGPEGTIFYCVDDKFVYVGVE
ncbi:MAG: hypothetical protein ACOYOS_00140 [Syntrophales bacterium]